MTTGTIGSGSQVAPGATTQVIFNDGGVMAGDAGFTYNKTTDLPTIAGLSGTGTRAVEASSTGLLSAAKTPMADLLSVNSFAAVASVTIDTRSIGGANLFGSDYANYDIIVHLTAFSSTTSIALYHRLRAAGADNGATACFAFRMGGLSSAATVTGANTNGGASCFNAATDAGAIGATWSLRLFGPNATLSSKRYTSHYSSTGNATAMGVCGGEVFAATQFTGIKFIPDSMNLTGVVKVYGLRDS